MSISGPTAGRRPLFVRTVTVTARSWDRVCEFSECCVTKWDRDRWRPSRGWPVSSWPIAPTSPHRLRRLTEAVVDW